ncbi:hypothetical protein SAMN05880570_4026 [Paenibacillus sp. RU4T]|uniref:hypothetical protein n=1 Tax=unclassified Paenibacillus TaxID=185978 RepID=UPI000956C6B5|nr:MULTISPECIES: hypothetical protein [unclassified Paenibacillus]SIR50387.1 hypothetical protein SAMN05880555_4023 [Paenibacillus sp. RU4X]SIR59457.1 hypothetical protein SAMN05880570_4026 [Paenibacillus sp. RU4T]
MAIVCPSSSSYPTKPSASTFGTTYKSYAQTAAASIGVSTAFVLCQWFQEWGIPINNPAFQASQFGHDLNASPDKCGSFFVFATLDDGVAAYADQINYSYNGGSHAWTNVFGNPVDVKNAYLNGFPGSLTATNVHTDNGYNVSVTSTHFGGKNDSGGSVSTGTFAANEMMGSSPWDGGHYMDNTDSYPGRKLNVIFNSNSTWATY